MSFKAGDWIKHPKFGDGLIKAYEDPYFLVRFVTDGEKRLQAAFVKDAGAAPTPDFRFPDAARASKRSSGASSKSKKPAHTFEHYVERFLALYPEGFEDAGFVKDERNYKLAAIKKLKETLSSEEMASLLSASNFGEVCRRAKQIASSLNIIFPQEMMSLSDSLKDDFAQKEFAISLHEVLYSSAPKESRFERYFEVLGKIGCPKWTVATYFQFLETGGTDMFMKPMVSQAMANATGISLLYRPEPNWDTCVRLNEVAAEVQSRLESAQLSPCDRIDVQSFMYVSWQSSK
jgi:hypothetical protein